MHPKDVNSNPTGERSDNPRPQETPQGADQRKTQQSEAGREARDRERPQGENDNTGGA